MFKNLKAIQNYIYNYPENKFSAKMPLSLLIDLRNPLLNVQPIKVFSDKEFKQIIKRIYTHLKENDKLHPKNYYHNRRHAKEAFQRAMILAKEYLLDTGLTQIIAFAILFHDDGHCGKSHRREPDGLTNEEFAAKFADKFAKSIGLNIYQRIAIFNMIISSTYLNPKIKPSGLLEEIVCLADISGFTKPYRKYIKEAINVLKEIPEEKRPKNINDWIKSKMLFFNSIEEQMPKDASPYWRERLNKTKQRVQNINTLREIYYYWLVRYNLGIEKI